MQKDNFLLRLGLEVSVPCMQALTIVVNLPQIIEIGQSCFMDGYLYSGTFICLVQLIIVLEFGNITRFLYRAMCETDELLECTWSQTEPPVRLCLALDNGSPRIIEYRSQCSELNFHRWWVILLAFVVAILGGLSRYMHFTPVWRTVSTYVALVGFVLWTTFMLCMLDLLVSDILLLISIVSFPVILLVITFRRLCCSAVRDKYKAEKKQRASRKQLYKKGKIAPTRQEFQVNWLDVNGSRFYQL